MRLKLTLATTAIGAAALAFATMSTPDGGPITLAAPVTVAFDNPTPMEIPDGGAVDSPIAVDGVNGPITKLRVSLHVTHPIPDDLVLRLIGPDGTTMILSEENGAAYDNAEPGENYGTGAQPVTARTIFDDDAVDFIYDAGAPFAGSFKPEEGTFAQFFGGKSGGAANGTWTLRIEDVYEEDTGTLHAWGIEITSDAP